ncbi:MAG: hypothetical protein ACUVX8_05220 [Candidatus Zipacnadales bacterium]
MSTPFSRASFWEKELHRLLPDPQAALEEALNYICCPICKILGDIPFEYFRFLPPRWEAEACLRESVCSAGGFCNRHTWQLYKMQALVPIAKVYADVLSAQMNAQAALERCPICQLQTLAAQRLLALFLERLADPNRRDEYQQVFGLCYPHLQQALVHNPPVEIHHTLIETHRARTERLVKLLQSYIEKDGVPAKWSRTEEEIRSPRWALLKMAGNEDL